MSPTDISRRIKAWAADLGFDRVGVARLGPIGRSDYLRSWLDSGRAGSMAYLHRNHYLRTDPRRLFDGARSVVVVATNYHQRRPGDEASADPRGRVAMYAWGADYHAVVKERLQVLLDRLRAEIDEPFEARCCVDTVPLLERELAALAGVGWIGKNTMVLHQELGSYFFLGELVTTLELACDAPVADRCGSCTRCLDACPTGAFPAPYEMDASRCISYLTIEHRGPIPATFHRAMDDWLFGCDVCQEVCPYNRDAPLSEAFGIRPPGSAPKLAEIARWSDEDYRQALQGSAMQRASLEMLQRNARIVSDNLADDSSAPGSPSPQEVEKVTDPQQPGRDGEGNDAGGNGNE